MPTAPRKSSRQGYKDRTYLIQALARKARGPKPELSQSLDNYLMNLWDTNNNVSLFITKYLARFRYDKIITDTGRIDLSQHNELRKSLIVDPTISNN